MNDAMLWPLRNSAFKFPTRVVLVTTKGAVPFAVVEITEAAVTVPVVFTGRPMVPDVKVDALDDDVNDAMLWPLRNSAFKFPTRVVLVTTKGAVPFAAVDANDSAVTVPVVFTGLPMVPDVRLEALDDDVNDAMLWPLRNSAFKFPTSVELFTENGAVPFAVVEITEAAVTVPVVLTGRVRVPVVRLAALDTTADVNDDALMPFRNSAFRLGTSVVLATVRGAVPVETVEVTEAAVTVPGVLTGRVTVPVKLDALV